MKTDLPGWSRFLFKPHRYKVVKGGRGSSKSWTFATTLILMAGQKRFRILCVREIQRSIEDSVYQLLKDTIERLGTVDDWAVQKTSIVHRVTGSQILFLGLYRNQTKVKGVEGVDITWVEEAEAVSQDSWDYLIPTIRKDDSEIWVSFNPDQKDDPVYRLFVDEDRHDTVVKHVTHRDNIWFPKVLRKEMEWDFAHDPEKAEWIWEGAIRHESEALVFLNKYVVRDFEKHPEEAVTGGPYYGADWGFSQDPSCLIRCYIADQSLWITHEAYGVGMDLDDTERAFGEVPESRLWSIVADSARPETIHEMNNRGFPIRGAKKGPGSVEDGITYLRSFKEINIHPRCIHAAAEFKTYSYVKDKLTGLVTKKLIDDNNHIIDALRYALEDARNTISIAFL